MNVGTGIAEPAASPAPAPPPPRPRIAWPGLAWNGSARPASWLPCDRGAAPEAPAGTERRRRGEAGPRLRMSRAHVRGALRRVLIVDARFLRGGKTAEAGGQSWLPEGFEPGEIGIASGGPKPGRGPRAFANRISTAAGTINARRRGQGAPASRLGTKLDVDPARHSFAHDRFAVVDDEPWHFGATVGGLHHGVDAASRGRDAGAAQAERFLDAVWRRRAGRSRAARTARGRGGP